MKKKRTLYLKFIITYLIFGVLSFITIATFTSSMTTEYLIKNEAASLYKEATLISNKYASYFYNSDISANEITGQLDAIDTLTTASIWIVNTDGQVIYTSRPELHSSDISISGFDPISNNSHYSVGNFYNFFDDEVLSVYSAITYNFKIPGYVVILYPMSNIYSKQQNILYIAYITLGIIFVLSLIILIVFGYVVYIPLKKITKAR